jgi:CHAD domain-containing protein
MATRYQETMLELVRRLQEGKSQPDLVHAFRTHSRRLQALLELCGDSARAQVMAKNVRRLSKLRALQVFHQYLIKIEASQEDLDEVDAWIQKKDLKLRHAHAYQQIEQAVWKHALPTLTHLNHSLRNRLEILRHAHEKNLTGLMEAALDNPRRKRLHALRLALKTIRYQTEWLPGRRESKRALVQRVKRVQAVLGRYEELADFRRWGNKLDLTVQARIEKDWKRARRRARSVPRELTWLVDAIASGHLWIGVEGSTTLLRRQAIRRL